MLVLKRFVDPRRTEASLTALCAVAISPTTTAASRVSINWHTRFNSLRSLPLMMIVEEAEGVDGVKEEEDEDEDEEEDGEAVEEEGKRKLLSPRCSAVAASYGVYPAPIKYAWCTSSRVLRIFVFRRATGSNDFRSLHSAL